MRKAARVVSVASILSIGLATVGGYAWYSSPTQQAKRAVLRQLSDPDSAVFSDIEVCKGSYVTGFVNSKNAYGGFTGKKRFVVDMFLADLENRTEEEAFSVIKVSFEGEPKYRSRAADQLSRAMRIYEDKNLPCSDLQTASWNEEQMDRDEAAQSARINAEIAQHVAESETGLASTEADDPARE